MYLNVKEILALLSCLGLSVLYCTVLKSFPSSSPSVFLSFKTLVSWEDVMRLHLWPGSLKDLERGLQRALVPTGCQQMPRNVCQLSWSISVLYMDRKVQPYILPIQDFSQGKPTSTCTTAREGDEIFPGGSKIKRTLCRASLRTSSDFPRLRELF